MRGDVLAIASLCVCAAICQQIMDQNRYQRVVRMVLGLQLAGVMLQIALKIVRRI